MQDRPLPEFLDKYDLINWYFDKLVLQSFEQIGMGHTVGESLTQKFEFIVNEKCSLQRHFAVTTATP